MVQSRTLHNLNGLYGLKVQITSQKNIQWIRSRSFINDVTPNEHCVEIVGRL